MERHEMLKRKAKPAKRTHMKTLNNHTHDKYQTTQNTSSRIRKPPVKQKKRKENEFEINL